MGQFDEKQHVPNEHFGLTSVYFTYGPNIGAYKHITLKFSHLFQIPWHNRYLLFLLLDFAKYLKDEVVLFFFEIGKRRGPFYLS